MGKAHELDREIGMLVSQERGVTRRLIEKIALFDQNHYYADLGYSSVMAWLINHHKYTKSAAFRRMQAARLIRAVPEAKEKIESGAVNLSTLASLQTAIRQEELRTKTSLPQERKEELISMIDSQPCEKVDRVIAIEFPNLDLEKKESVKPVNKSDTKIVLVFSEEDMKVLKRMREVSSHSHFNSSWSKLYVVAAKEFLKHHDPLLKKPRMKKENPALETPLSLPRTAAKQALSRTDEPRATKISRSRAELRATEISRSNAVPRAIEIKHPHATRIEPPFALENRKTEPAGTSSSSKTKNSNFTLGQNGSASEPNELKFQWHLPSVINTSPVSFATRGKVIRRDEGACRYVDPVTGRRCCSRDQIEVDHIVPRSLGGSNDPSNLRVLCRTHNLTMARRRFGRDFMEEKMQQSRH